VGFSFAAIPRATERLLSWLRWIIVISCVYGLLYVFADQITALSPTLSGASGQAVPILGSFAMTGTMLLWGAFACLIEPAERARARMLRTFAAGLLVAFAVVVLQMRTTYLQLIVLAGLLLIVRPRTLGRLGSAIPVLLLLLLIITAFDIRISGRLTSEISLSFFWNHVQAIFGIGAAGQGAVAEAAGGVPLRLQWWQRIYEQLTADPVTLLTGLGYGIPLTDFRDGLGVTTREPHNSVVSVVARLGLIGFVSWIFMQVELFRAGFRAYRVNRRNGRNDEARFPLLVLAFAGLTLIGCVGEDNMEKPYYAIPYYTLWGFVLRVAYRQRVEARSTQPVYAGGEVVGAAAAKLP
jgi:O-antigen ligase